jgi:dihydroxyacetone kinase-like predicted kinase
VPEALAALVLYDPEASAEANATAMRDAADSVATGEVTRAVRDTTAEVGRITAGDWIGLVRGDGIVSVSGSLEGAATSLLDQLVTDDREILTIITGMDAPPAVTVALQAWTSDNRAGVQVEVHAGGQPLYPYLFGVE